jgi:hypothetical protein
VKWIENYPKNHARIVQKVILAAQARRAAKKKHVKWSNAKP